MHQQPSVQQAVQARLAVEIALFFADIFNVVHYSVDGSRGHGAQLRKHGLGIAPIVQRMTISATMPQIWLDGLLVSVLELLDGAIVHADERSGHGASHAA